MDIRRALADDALGVATVHVRSWQAAYRGLMPDVYLDQLDVERRRAGWERSIAETDWPRTGTLVATEANGTVVGFAHVGPARDDDLDPLVVGELAAIYLLPQVWGSGVGRRLMLAAVNVLRDAGFAEAILWVLEGNERAQRFYEIGGWQLHGVPKDVVIADVNLAEVRYRLTL
ncbi:MAG TPA: GNAT family N-acetyltransferase [Acidothermaceae bacterium]|nr:GNAT family N-acetyltransferase [Acidothermaceae bacterium]